MRFGVSVAIERRAGLNGCRECGDLCFDFGMGDSSRNVEVEAQDGSESGLD